jgi:proteasome lid subunit RPN8/RPN11
MAGLYSELVQPALVWRIHYQSILHHHSRALLRVKLKFYSLRFKFCSLSSRDLPENYIIIAGATYIYEPESSHDVVTIHTHPAYDPYTLQNDISVWEVS